MMWLALFVSTVLAAAFLTGLLRRYALHVGLIDRPNARSSHSTPTPRGGGLAIVAVSAAVTGLLAVLQIVPFSVFAALIGGGLAVALVGFLDDRHHLPAEIRLVVHLGAALWALGWLGGLPPVRIGDHIASFGWAGYLLGALGIVWVLNLFNFMDGIDGIAASEAVFVAWGGALLGTVRAASSAAPAAASAFGAACCGFLLWNWPPAKIFMGDVGSGYTGYVIAVLALAAMHNDPTALWIWLILGGVFFVDATVTLARRIARGEQVHQAHRSHAYQWLARRWASHKRVTVAVILVNLLWLFPCAFLATVYPAHAAWIVVCALSPLAVAAVAIGAGRREVRLS